MLPVVQLILYSEKNILRKTSTLGVIFSLSEDPQCIFDFVATGDEDIAIGTATAQANVARDTEILGE